MPLPWCRNVDEVEIIARDESFEIVVAVCVNARSLLAGLFDHLSGAGALVFYDVADSVYDDVFDGEEFAQDFSAAEADADDAEADGVVGFESHAEHCALLGAALLCGFFGFRRICLTD